MHRRELLKKSALGFLGLGLAGCATGTGSLVTAPRLPRVRASWERVIRTTVGLRPYRRSGFLLRADRVDDKLLVHNYGHGGAGMSLSWGTGEMAAELSLGREERIAAVVGCGVVGLTTARQLQRRGFDVTIYAMAVPPNTTSNMSLAGWTPTSGLVEGEHRTLAWEADFRQAASIAYRQLQLLVGRGYGLSWIDTYSFTNTPPRSSEVDERYLARAPLLPVSLSPGTTILPPGEHPFPARYARRATSLRIEPSIYLDRLVRDFLEFGGEIVMRKFDTARDLMSLSERVIVNCTGLGSYDLIADHELMPVKGQLTHLVPQPEVNYGTFGGVPGADTGGFIHMQPRQDGIALGGTTEEGVWDLEPNPEARRRVVEAHIELFASMNRGG